MRDPRVLEALSGLGKGWGWGGQEIALRHLTKFISKAFLVTLLLVFANCNLYEYYMINTLINVNHMGDGLFLK